MLREIYKYMNSKKSIEFKSKNYSIDGDKVVENGKKYASDNADLMKRLANL